MLSLGLGVAGRSWRSGLQTPHPRSLSLDLGPMLGPRLLCLQVLNQSHLHRSCSWEGCVLRFQVDMSLERERGAMVVVLSTQDTPCVQLSVPGTILLEGVCKSPCWGPHSPLRLARARA